MNIRHNLNTLVILVVGILLVTPLRDLVLIPAIQKDVVFFILFGWLLIAGWRGSKRADYE
jgi:hypothetical protein